MSNSFEFANNHSTSNVFARRSIGEVFFRMESAKSANTKVSQFEILVQYMTKHPDLSKGYLKTPEARQKSKHLWTNLSKDLNAEGPPQRDAVGWKKVWADLKVHTKAKLRKNKINLSGTGGGPPKYHSLTPLEEKVSELLDLGQAIDGMNGTLSFGLHDVNCISDQHVDDEDGIGMYNGVVADDTEIENNFNDVLSPEKENVPQPRKTPKQKQTSLLGKQVEHQIAYQNNSSNAMKEINENLKGILKYKRRDFELNEKNYKLKKEELELKKQKFEFKKQSHVQKNKTTVAKLELKKEMLRLRQEMEPY